MFLAPRNSDGALWARRTRLTQQQQQQQQLWSVLLYHVRLEAVLTERMAVDGRCLVRGTGLCDGDVGHETGVQSRIEAGRGMLSVERGSSKVYQWAAAVFGREMDGFVVDGWGAKRAGDVGASRGGAALS